jgi:hypothetical protein
MADESNDPPSGTGMPPRVRRRAPTIELKATEVAVEPQEMPPADSPPASAEPESNPASRFNPELPRYEDMGAPPEPPPPPSETPRSWPVGPHLIEAGLAGGAVALLVFAMLWLGGMFSGGDNRSAAPDPRIAVMEARLRDMAARPATNAVDTKAVDELAARLAKLEAAPRASANDAGFAEAIKNLQTRVEDTASATREARGRADAALLAADAARVAVERNNVEAMSNRIAALETAAKTLSSDVAKSLAAAGDRPLRAAVAAQALRASVERGDPFAAELAAAKAAAPDPQALAALEPFAAAGLPSGVALAGQLSDLAPAMLRASNAPTPTGGFLDRLQANAERLVRVRPIDEAPGDDPAAVISRAQSKAARSDFAGALSELNALPANMRAPAEDWIQRVEARNAALAASRRLVSDALAGLNKSP